MKKLVSIVLAVIAVLTMTISAFAATEHSEEAMKICNTAGCLKVNEPDAEFCRSCGESLADVEVQIGDAPWGKGGQFAKCPYCKYYNPNGASECHYCDKDISELDFWVSVTYETCCPDCGTYAVSDDPSLFFEELSRDEYLYWVSRTECLKCGHIFTEEDNLEIIRYTNDTEDPEYNWDERKTVSGANSSESSFFVKIIEAIKDFFESIANFLANLF